MIPASCGVEATDISALMLSINDSNGVNFAFWIASMSVGDYIHVVNRDDTSLFGIYKLESIFTPLISIDKQKATLSKVAGPLSIVNSTNIEYNIAYSNNFVLVIFQSKKYGDVAFSILMNGYTDYSSRYARVHDQIVKSIIYD